MSRLNQITPEQATGELTQIYSAIKSKVGMIPNLYQGVGNSPKTLATLLGLPDAQTSLNAVEK